MPPQSPRVRIDRPKPNLQRGSLCRCTTIVSNCFLSCDWLNVSNASNQRCDDAYRIFGDIIGDMRRSGRSERTVSRQYP